MTSYHNYSLEEWQKINKVLIISSTLLTILRVILLTIAAWLASKLLVDFFSIGHIFVIVGTIFGSLILNALADVIEDYIL